MRISGSNLKKCIDNFENSYPHLFQKWGFESRDLRDDVLGWCDQTISTSLFVPFTTCFFELLVAVLFFVTEIETSKSLPGAAQSSEWRIFLHKCHYLVGNCYTFI